MNDFKTTQQHFGGMGELGVSLAFHDFGTGWSSLDNLRQWPVQQLKVDRKPLGAAG